MRVHYSRKSSNAKTGPIPVTTTERKSCPKSCPFYDAGCYATTGPLFLHWQKVSEGLRGVSWPELCETIAALPKGQLWRHNQAGDLPGDGETIDQKALGELVRANMKKRGFTYTHYPTTKENLDAIRIANLHGFTINLSANNLAHADEMSALNVAPVTVVLPSDTIGKKIETPQGRAVTVCPATYREDVTCASCKLCAVSDRKTIVGFPAHGTQKKKADIIARAAA